MADIRKELNQIKNAVYGREVRGSIHDGIDKVNRESEGSRQIANNTEQRQDAVEQQFNTLLGEWSDDKPIDNAETIAARTNTKESKTYENLGKRLDEEYGKVTAQLAETDDQSFLNRPISRWSKPKPMITFHDDDGHLGFYTKMFQVAKEYNIPIVSAMITDRPMGFPGDDRPQRPQNYTYEQVMEMKESGLVEFVSHTHTHPLNMDSLPREVLHEEFVKSREFMRKWGFNYRVVVIPGGHINDKVIEEARQVYEYMTTYGSQNELVIPPFSNYTIPRVSLDQDIEVVKQYINEAYEKNAWIILRTHVDQAPSYSNEKFREIIEYAQSLDFEFVTTEEGIKHHGNILEVNNNELIAADGSFHGKRLGRVILDSSMNVTADTPLTDFEPNTVTYSRITTGNTTGFPSSLNRDSGVLKTTRLHNSDMFWNFQEFYPNSEDVTYIRHWVDVGYEQYDPFDEIKTYPGWTNWKLREVTHYKGTDSYTANTTIDDYATGITLEVITSNGYNDDLPSRSGTLTTYKTKTQTKEYSYQEFLRYKYNLKYVRYATEDGWSDWKKQSDYRHEPINTFDGTSTPDEFEIGTTLTYISGIPEGLPGVSSGNLLTVKEAGLGRSYQEFRASSSGGSKYFRGELSDGSWGGWKKYVMEDV